MQTRQRRYKLDLSGLHAECEANYARLMRLLPDFETIDRREFQCRSGATTTQVCLEITQRCPYTTMINVSQHESPTPWVEPPRFEVRLYHDALMAEVVQYSGVRRVSPRYDYPNEGMHQRDEKHQLNRFLGEWLSHCIDTGHCVEEVDLCEC